MIKIIAIKDMSVGNAEVGDMWQETKEFNETSTLLEVMQWVGTHKKRVTLTIPEGSIASFDELPDLPF